MVVANTDNIDVVYDFKKDMPKNEKPWNTPKVHQHSGANLEEEILIPVYNPFKINYSASITITDGGKHLTVEKTILEYNKPTKTKIIEDREIMTKYFTQRYLRKTYDVIAELNDIRNI
jgi:hypothetical protein